MGLRVRPGGQLAGRVREFETPVMIHPMGEFSRGSAARGGLFAAGRIRTPRRGAIPCLLSEHVAFGAREFLEGSWFCFRS
jgi:hypothetical protein